MKISRRSRLRKVALRARVARANEKDSNHQNDEGTGKKNDGWVRNCDAIFDTYKYTQRVVIVRKMTRNLAQHWFHSSRSTTTRIPQKRHHPRFHRTDLLYSVLKKEQILQQMKEIPQLTIW